MSLSLTRTFFYKKITQISRAISYGRKISCVNVRWAVLATVAAAVPAVRKQKINKQGEFRLSLAAARLSYVHQLRNLVNVH